MLEMLKKFTVEDGFFGRFRQLVTDVVIPYQEKALHDEIPGAVPVMRLKILNWQLSGRKPAIAPASITAMCFRTVTWPSGSRRRRIP